MVPGSQVQMFKKARFWNFLQGAQSKATSPPSPYMIKLSGLTRFVSHESRA
jgi:hypothetical protein